MTARTNIISSAIPESTFTRQSTADTREMIATTAISRINCSRFKLKADSSLAPELVDCSSFVQWVFRKCGYDLPRLSYQQAEFGNNVSRETILPGDLIFTTSPAFNWELSNGLRIGHVCICTQSGIITHATSDHCYVTMESIESLAQRREITYIKRIIETP